MTNDNPDFAAQSHLATVECQAQIIATMRGELAAKEAECAELASRINASAPSVERNAVLEGAAVVSEYEQVEETGSEGDNGYNNAIRHVAASIRDLKSAAPVAQPLAASAVPEGAISAAMSEGNKHGVKSTAAARIVAAYLAAAPRQEAQPEHSDKPAVNSVALNLDAQLRAVVKERDLLRQEAQQAVQVPPELRTAFITLESSGGEGRNIVLKFNQRDDAYAVHDFLLKGGSIDYNCGRAAPSQQPAASEVTRIAFFEEDGEAFVHSAYGEGIFFTLDCAKKITLPAASEVTK